MRSGFVQERPTTLLRLVRATCLLLLRAELRPCSCQCGCSAACFCWKVLEELFLTHEKRLRQVVRLHGINTAHTIRKVAFAAILQQSLLVKDAFTYNQVMCLSSVQLQGALLVSGGASPGMWVRRQGGACTRIQRGVYPL